MYTKVFRQIYDGTLADNWQALVTFQQLLILADDSGVVDMTVGAIHRTTGIPTDILEAGISALEAPDVGSRTPDMEGRRIVRLDEHRPWGWFLVNFRKYRQMTSREEKKAADRDRINAKRHGENTKKISPVATCRKVSQGVADVAHTEADTDTKAERSKELALSPSDSPLPAVVSFLLNDKSEFGITDEHLQTFRETYPGIDVLGELRKVKAWAVANPAKRKTRRGALAFVNNWLARAQDRGPRPNGDGRRDMPVDLERPRTSNVLGGGR